MPLVFHSRRIRGYFCQFSVVTKQNDFLPSLTENLPIVQFINLEGMCANGVALLKWITDTTIRIMVNGWMFSVDREIQKDSGVFPKWSRTLIKFSEFSECRECRESDKLLRHEFEAQFENHVSHVYESCWYYGVLLTRGGRFKAFRWQIIFVTELIQWKSLRKNSSI